MSESEDAAARAADPRTTGEELALLAHSHPELRAIVARNPAAYPDLITWIGQYGDEFARSAVADRTRGESIQTVGVPVVPPTSAPGKRRVLVVVLAAAGAALAAVVVTALVMSSLTPANAPVSQPETSTPTASPTPVQVQPALVADLPKLPIAPVVVRSDSPGYNLNPVQRFADHVAAGDTAALVSKCWTFAPDTILDRYASDAARGAVLDALSTSGLTGERGIVWVGQLVEVSFPWPELESTYACPFVVIHGAPNPYSAVDAAWLIHRLAGRLNGTPVAAGDTEAVYPLICDPSGWAFAPDETTPPASVDPAPVYSVVLALEGHPIEVTWLEVGDYYDVHSPEVPGISIVVEAGLYTCVGEAR
ncbi:MAG: hypothetical protein ABI435_00390 [Pseudolysinimonas sp.]